jgi:hypothetical protein
MTTAVAASAGGGEEPSSPAAPRLGDAQTQQYRIGLVVVADGAPCRGMLATMPVPMDWPEQQVRVLREEKTPHVGRMELRTVGGGARQLVVQIPSLPAGAEARAIVTVEVTRHATQGPQQTAGLRIPQRVDSALRPYLAESPMIESNHAKIRNLARQIVAEREGAWEQAEAIYDWVREHIEYREGDLKGALQALADGTGDCEEMTSLFIALCRASRIPARTVWVPGHCYPEFYLEDEHGNGYWYPCQAAGTRAFGSMPEYRPILQKGDSFRVPETPREIKRYVAEYFMAQSGRPRVAFVREAVAPAHSSPQSSPQP